MGNTQYFQYFFFFFKQICGCHLFLMENYFIFSYLTYSSKTGRFYLFWNRFANKLLIQKLLWFVICWQGEQTMFESQPLFFVKKINRLTSNIVFNIDDLTWRHISVLFKIRNDLIFSISICKLHSNYRCSNDLQLLFFFIINSGKLVFKTQLHNTHLPHMDWVFW